MPGAVCVGETYLGLVAPGSAATIASSHNYQDGTCAFLQFTATAAGSYSIQEGCVGSTQCSGTVAYSITAPPAALPSGSTGRCAAYSSDTPQVGNVIGSKGLAPMYATCDVTLAAGDTILLGTTYVAGAACGGSTFLGLSNPDGTLVSFSNNVGSDGANVCSFMQATATQAGTYTIQEGCSAGVSAGCSGTVVYMITSGSPLS
jgi:hypothetical protein